jgi:hypothetical protein
MKREWILTKAVKRYDKDLFVKRAENGMMFLIRNKTKLDHFEFNGVKVYYSKVEPQEILALTDTWTSRGQAVDWGIEPLMQKITEIDGHRSHEILDRINKAVLGSMEAKDKARDSEMEAKAYESRYELKKIFQDYNVSSMDQTDVRTKLEKKGKLKNVYT